MFCYTLPQPISISKYITDDSQSQLCRLNHKTLGCLGWITLMQTWMPFNSSGLTDLAYCVDISTKTDDLALGLCFHRVLKHLLKLLYK